MHHMMQSPRTLHSEGPSVPGLMFRSHHLKFLTKWSSSLCFISEFWRGTDQGAWILSPISHCLSASLGWYWASSSPPPWCPDSTQLSLLALAPYQTHKDSRNLSTCTFSEKETRGYTPPKLESKSRKGKILSSRSKDTIWEWGKGVFGEGSAGLEAYRTIGANQSRGTKGGGKDVPRERNETLRSLVCLLDLTERGFTTVWKNWGKNWGWVHKNILATEKIR